MRDNGTRRAPWALVLLMVTLPVLGTDAHKGITSRYTYNTDVYPILSQRCGTCHRDGGPTPMSLLTYRDNGGAVAWAESIRLMLLSEAMPPWYADPTGPAVKNSHSLTPRELDIIVTWATGGTPEGDPTRAPWPSSAPPGWSLGKPDATLSLAPHTLAAGTMEATVDMTVPTSFTDAKWVKAVDLLPGTPSIVRQATLSLVDGQTLAVWQPGDDAVAAPGGTAFMIPAGAVLHARLRYKKGWQDEAIEKSDTSIIGLYFTDKPLSGKAISTVVVEPKVIEVATEFGAAMNSGGRVIALRPQVDQPYAVMEISATLPSGRKVPLLKLRGIRPEWPRRYWLADPVELPKGTRIEVMTKAIEPGSAAIGPGMTNPLRVSLDIVGH